MRNKRRIFCTLLAIIMVLGSTGTALAASKTKTYSKTNTAYYTEDKTKLIKITRKATWTVKSGKITKRSLKVTAYTTVSGENYKLKSSQYLKNSINKKKSAANMVLMSDFKRAKTDPVRLLLTYIPATISFAYFLISRISWLPGR